MESSKRPRTPGSTSSSSSQNVQCLADGCNADLTQCRDYHRRHKVCEFHSKSPTVTISGGEQRFCQQCSRFHLLAEFDDVKRSCRKRLDGHNKRRRKPQPDLRNAGLVLNNQKGTRLMSFSTPQICPGGVISNSWTSIVKTENDYVMYNKNNDNKNNDQTNWNSSSNTCRASSSANHLQVMQQNNEPPGSSGYGGEQIISSNQKTIFPSDSALSLLSSQSAPSAMEVGFNPMVLNPHHRHLHHHNEPMLSSSQSQTAAATAQIVHNSQFSGGGNRFLFRSDAENNKSLVSEADDSHCVSGNASFQFQEMFQNEPDESSGSGSHQTLTFLWE